MSTATPRQAEFDYLVWVTKPLLRVDEAGAILRVAKDTIYSLAAEGALEAHQADRERSHIKITRRSVVAYLARTARYVDADFTDTVYGLASRLNRDERTRLLKKLSTLS